MSFLFPRTISIARPNLPVNGAHGLQAYQGITEADESSLITGIPANIEIAAIGRLKGGPLPSDAAGPVRYSFTLPASANDTLPALIEGDVIYDDMGRRFQLAAIQPTDLGATFEAVRMLE